MKKSILSMIILLTTFIAKAQWTPQISGTTRNLHDVDFIDVNNGIAVGDSGTFLVTSDGGANWSQLSTGITGNINIVEFVNTDTVLISLVDQNGYPAILYSSNTGNSWQTIATDSFCNRPLDIDSRTGTPWFATGTSIVSSNDAGASWDTLLTYTCSSVTINTIKMQNNQVINGGGNSIGITSPFATMIRSEDGGNHFYLCDPLGFPTDDILTAFYFTYPDTGLIFVNRDTGFGSPGPFNKLFKFSNYHLRTIPGDTVFDYFYQIVSSQVPAYINDAYYQNSSNGFAAGDDGMIYETTDGGLVWTSAYDNSGNSFHKFSFPDPFTGYAIGDSGTIVKYFNTTEIDDLNTLKISIYPNPANNVLNVRGLLPGKIYKYQIIDITGKILLEGIPDNSGKINLEKVSTGAYYFTLSNELNSIHKIFIVSK